MTDGRPAAFPAREIWGLNRKRPCVLIVDDSRLVVIDRGRRPVAVVMREIERRGVDSVGENRRYTLPLESVRWVLVRRVIGGTIIKVQTSGGAYRFIVRPWHRKRVQEQLVRALGDKVRIVGG